MPSRRSLCTKLATAGAAATTIIALAACSSSGSQSPPSSSGSSGSGSDAALHGTPVKILVSGPLSSPTFSVPQVAAGAEAAASSLNAKGGISGHPIQIIACNDQSNPNQAAQCAQTAASDHVTAVTGFFLFGPQIFDATEAAGIPVLDSQPISADAGTSANSFPINAGGIAEYVGIGRQVVENGDSSVVLMPNNTAAADYNAGFAKQGVEAAHGTVIRSVTATAGAPDYAPYVQQALAGGKTKAIIFVGTPEDFPKLVLAAKQANFQGVIASVIGQVPPATAKALAGSGVNILVSSNFYVPPAAQASAFGDDMSKYQPKATVDVFSEGTWAAVQAIAKALKGNSQVNAAALTAALSSSTSLNIGSMMPAIDMTAKGPIPGNPRFFNPDVIILKVANGDYTPSGGFFNPFGS